MQPNPYHLCSLNFHTSSTYFPKLVSKYSNDLSSLIIQRHNCRPQVLLLVSTAPIYVFTRFVRRKLSIWLIGALTYSDCGIYGGIGRNTHHYLCRVWQLSPTTLNIFSNCVIHEIPAWFFSLPEGEGRENSKECRNLPFSFLLLMTTTRFWNCIAYICVCWSSTCENKWPQKSAESHINVNAGLFGSSITGLLKQVLLHVLCAWDGFAI